MNEKLVFPKRVKMSISFIHLKIARNLSTYFTSSKDFKLGKGARREGSSEMGRSNSGENSIQMKHYKNTIRKPLYANVKIQLNITFKSKQYFDYQKALSTESFNCVHFLNTG